MAIKTKHTFPNTTNSTTDTFTGHGIELNNQDDLDVYVTLVGGTRVLQHRQATASTTDSNHEQVNDTTGLYFPSVATGVTLYNYTLSTDFNTITFNSNLPLNTVVSVERRTRDSSSNYTNFTSGGSIRSTELNSAFDESNFTAQEARNKAFDLENKLFHSDFTPYSDNTIDLGSSTKEWKNLYVDGTGYIDAIDGGILTISGTTNLDGHTNIGNSAANTVTIKAKVDHDFLPNVNGTYDLGSSNFEWQDLWVTGTGNIDAIVADTATINGNLVVTGTISDSGGNLELNDDVNISGHLRFPDDKKIYLGNGDDASIDWDTDGWFDRVNIRSNGDIWSYVPSGENHLFLVNNSSVFGIYETYIEAKQDLKPYGDGTIDLGASNKEWKDLYVDGTGYIDTVSADAVNSTAATITTGNITTVNSTTVTSTNGAFTTLTTSSNATVSGVLTCAGFQLSGSGNVSSDLITSVSSGTIGYDLGQSNKRWDQCHFNDVFNYGDIQIGASSSNTVTLNSKIGSNILPTGTRDIGASDAKWNKVWTTDLDVTNGQLNTLGGMQSGTASKLADGTLTADIADLNQIDGLTKQTTISDSDASFPTSGAVVDYVAAQLAPVGGLEVIATDAAFPNTQPASGVVVSIADAGGLVVNGSGVSTTGRTVGGSTVTINNINSQFNSTTIDNGVAMMVSSTGSGQVYNYHKATLREQDILSISSDIQSFGNRYRVGSSNPSSDNDAGDLFFNTATDKLLVRNAANNSWDEAQSVGNFYISTLSPAFDGSTTDFTITNAPTYASQVLLIINGVLQKPNAGTSAPADGFALDGSTVKLGGAPATGSTYSAVVIGSTVNIGTPSDNTVSASVLQSGSVTTAKIAADAVDGTKIADDAVGAEHIEVLDANLQLADSVKIQVGTDNDIEIYHTGSHGYIDCATGNLLLRDTGSGSFIIRTNDFNVQNAAGGETMIWGDDDAAVKLYYDGSPKLETTANGAKVTGTAGSYALEVNHPDWNTLKLINTNANTYGPYLDMYHNSASPADGDEAGEIRFLANDDAGGTVVYGQMRVLSYDVSNGSEDGQFDLQLRNNDVLEEKLKIASTGNALFSANEVKLYNATDTANTYFYAQNTGGGNAGIKMKNSSGEWTIIANDRLRFIDDDAGVERLSILSDGNVGIGTTSPADLLHVSGSSGVPGLIVENTSNSAREAAIYLKGRHSNGTVRQLMLKYDDNDTFRIHTAGSIPIIFETSDAERIRITNDGITFNGDTAAANALDDYEEGTFDPTLRGHDGSSWSEVTFDSVIRYGWYTKIGNVCRVWIRFYNFHIDSGFDGDLAAVGGLPFSSSNTAYKENILSICNANAFAESGAYNIALDYNTNTGITRLMSGTGSGYATFSGSTGRYLTISGSYSVG